MTLIKKQYNSAICINLINWLSVFWRIKYGKPWNWRSRVLSSTRKKQVIESKSEITTDKIILFQNLDKNRRVRKNKIIIGLQIKSQILGIKVVIRLINQNLSLNLRLKTKNQRRNQFLKTIYIYGDLLNLK